MEQERHAEALHRVGSVIADRYELIDLRGVGGMGAVYAARHLFTGNLVALKVLYPDVARQRDAAERFAREARAPGSINHPNICRVLDAGTEPVTGERYIAMELLDGHDLAYIIENGSIDLATLLDASLQVLDALSAAHARGFVHRDIKPENIFLTPLADGRHRARLLDFGVARRPGHEPSRMTEPGHIVGTVWYMSPEQARGLEIDHRADLWAFGAVLFHALAGQPPFDGDNHNQLLYAIGTTDAPSLEDLRPELPRAVIDAIDRALEPSIDDRWQTAREMHRALCTALASLDGTPLRVQSTLRRDRTRDLWLTGSPATFPPPRPTRSASRDMLRGAVIAAVVLVGILAAASMIPRNTARATASPASLWHVHTLPHRVTPVATAAALTRTPTLPLAPPSRPLLTVSRETTVEPSTVASPPRAPHTLSRLPRTPTPTRQAARTAETTPRPTQPRAHPTASRALNLHHTPVRAAGFDQE